MAKIENAPVLLAGGYDPTMPGNKRVVGIPATWPAQLLETGISCDVVLVEVLLLISISCVICLCASYNAVMIVGFSVRRTEAASCRLRHHRRASPSFH
eukprot:SAG31_NODE_420_length_15868_cov_11.896823_2_plen_98_part_00